MATEPKQPEAPVASEPTPAAKPAAKPAPKVAAKKPTPKPVRKAPVKAKAKPAPKKIEPVQAAVQAGQETVETVVKTSTEVAKKGVEKVVAISQDQVDAAVKAGSDAFKGYEDAIEFSKSNIEACVKANEILTSGLTELNTAIVEATQSNIEESIAIAQKIMACTSIVDVIALQTEYAKAGYVTTIERSRHLSSISAKLADDATKPLAERVTATVERATKPIAA